MSTNQDPQKQSEKPTNTPNPDSPGFFNYIKNNKVDVLAYVLLFIGLLLSFFERVIGGLIVGFILGTYFSIEIKEEVEKFKEFISHEGIFRGFVLVAAAVSLMIASPGLCLGTIVGVLVRPFIRKDLPSDKK